MLTDDRIIDDLIRREGDAFTNRAADRGGRTRYGITQATLSGYLGRQASAADVMAVTEDLARTIYRREFIEAPGFVGIRSDALRALLVDSGVQHNPRRPIRWLQEAVGVAADGRLGPITMAAANEADPLRVFLAVLAKRQRFYGRIVTDDYLRHRKAGTAPPMQAENAAGWANRLAEFLESAV